MIAEPDEAGGTPTSLLTLNVQRLNSTLIRYPLQLNPVLVINFHFDYSLAGWNLGTNLINHLCGQTPYLADGGHPFQLFQVPFEFNSDGDRRTEQRQIFQGPIVHHLQSLCVLSPIISFH